MRTFYPGVKVRCVWRLESLGDRQTWLGLSDGQSSLVGSVLAWGGVSPEDTHLFSSECSGECPPVALKFYQLGLIVQMYCPAVIFGSQPLHVSFMPLLIYPLS